ncbi:hypothetical protein PROVRETT_05430 [Providencia rettgeri DSM 1131]|nr:hypothetical protein PROVRETT_05430 [Providencia rettgeri DSM 1131]
MFLGLRFTEYRISCYKYTHARKILCIKLSYTHPTFYTSYLHQ